jgi:hypothetical protein
MPAGCFQMIVRDLCFRRGSFHTTNASISILICVLYTKLDVFWSKYDQSQF